MKWTVAPEPVTGEDAVALSRAYLDDIIGRYYGRPATAVEIDEEYALMPVRDLAPPRGVFLVARDAAGVAAEGPAGCAGVRLLSPKIAELKHVWIRPGARRQGLGARLVSAAERAAAGLGATAVRLDTRSDLTEARRLYERHGYVEIPPYHDDPYAEHFFEKRLG